MRRLSLPLSRQQLAEFSFALALTILVFFGAVLIISLIGFSFNQPITRIYAPIALVAAIVLSRFVVSTNWFALLATIIVLLALATLLNLYLADVTCDGQGYQGTGVVQLLEGWNPLHDPQRATVLQPIAVSAIRHFTKGPWIVAATIGKVTNKVEAGKAINLLTIFSCFCLVHYSLLSYSTIPHRLVILISAITAANPISMSQCFTYYVDGQLAALFTVLCVSGWLYFQRPDLRHGILLIVTIILLVNAKLSGLFYAGLIALTLLTAFVIKWRWRQIRWCAVTLLLGFLLASAVGFNPYITNWRQTRNPIYPFGNAGDQSFQRNFQENQKPVVLHGHGNIGAFLKSLFSRSDNHYDFATRAFPGAPIKIPFSLRGEEIVAFSDVDVRLAGWGPWMSGIILIGAIAIVWRQSLALFVCALLLLTTVLVMPESWYARYTPQVWLLPCLGLTACFIRSGSRTLGWLLACFMIANIVMVTFPYLHRANSETHLLNQQLDVLAHLSAPCRVALGDNQINRRRFMEHGIRFVAVETLPATEPHISLPGAVLIARTIVALPDQ